MMENMLKSVRDNPNANWRESVYMAALRKLNKNDISIRFRNASDGKPTFDLFHFMSDHSLTVLCSNHQQDLQDTKDRPRNSRDPHI